MMCPPGGGVGERARTEGASKKGARAGLRAAAMWRGPEMARQVGPTRAAQDGQGSSWGYSPQGEGRTTVHARRGPPGKEHARARASTRGSPRGNHVERG